MENGISPNPARELGEFFAAHENWLIERLLEYSKRQGYTEYSSTLPAAWRQSVSGLCAALSRALDILGLDGMELTPQETFKDDPISTFAMEESRLHRVRGVALSMFLGLFKYYRQTFLDLIREEGGELSCVDQCRISVERFFDRLEIAFCTDWVGVQEEDRIEELQRTNLVMTNEKNKLLTLFESLVSPVFLLDDALNIEFMNLAAARYFGLAEDPGELYYARCDVVQEKAEQPEKIPLVRHAPWLAECLDEKCSINSDHGCRFDVVGNTTLGRRNFSVSASHMSDVSNKFSGVTLVLNDITDHIQVERQLERERNRAASYLDIIGSIVLALDTSGIITLFNKAGLKALGYEKHEVLGQNWFELAIPEDEKEAVRRYYHSMVFEGASPQGEYVNHVVNKEGRLRLISWNTHILTSDEGNIVGVLAAGTDITARAEADRLLREREKLYRAFFENNHAVMLLQNPRNGSLVDANPAASKFYGYSIDAMKNMNMADLETLSEEDVFREMAEAREERRANFISRHRLSNGDVRDVEIYSGPILVEGRQLLYSLIHDITERVRLEKEMERMATTDALTGADNRHQFFRRAGEELSRSTRYSHPLCVLMLDIDYFKSINDAHGHQAGDDVLKVVVDKSRSALRETDVFGRLGGEEFAAILPETDLSAGLLVAERLRESLSLCEVESPSGEVMRFTVSIGVSERMESDPDMDAIIRRADEGLYRAKRMGRNRVEKG